MTGQVRLRVRACLWRGRTKTSCGFRLLHTPLCPEPSLGKTTSKRRVLDMVLILTQSSLRIHRSMVSRGGNATPDDQAVTIRIQLSYLPVRPPHLPVDRIVYLHACGAGGTRCAYILLCAFIRKCLRQVTVQPISVLRFWISEGLTQAES